MRERSLPLWFPITIVTFVAVLFVVAYEADPPMAFLMAGLMAAFFLVTRIVDRQVDARERRESEPQG